MGILEEKREQLYIRYKRKIDSIIKSAKNKDYESCYIILSGRNIRIKEINKKEKVREINVEIERKNKLKDKRVGELQIEIQSGRKRKEYEKLNKKSKGFVINIYVKEGDKLFVYEHLDVGDKKRINILYNIFVKSKGSIEWIRKVSTSGFVSNNYYIKLERAANLKLAHIDNNKGISLDHYKIRLYNGANSEVRIINYGNKNSIKDVTIEVDQIESKTKSLVSIKNIVNGCMAIGKGIINIERKSKHSEAFLEVHNLINKRSELYFLPVIEVKNKEVRATHAASAYKVNDEQLYYLMSRGFNKKESKKLLELSFVSDFLLFLYGFNIRKERLKKLLPKHFSGIGGGNEVEPIEKHYKYRKV